MRRQIPRLALSIALAFSTGCAVAAANSATKFDANETAVAKKLENTYNVKVLRIRSGEMNGSAIYIVTVMNPAGNYNAAFRVSTLAVDKSTGALISQYRQTPTGQQRSGADSYYPQNEELGMILRRQTERRQRQH